MFFFNPGLFIEFTCFFIAFFTLFRDRQVFWKITIVYLLFTCIIELITFILLKVYHQRTFWLYNLYIPVEATFITYVFHTFLRRLTRINHLFWLGYGIIITVYIIELFKRNFGYTSTAVSVMSVIFVLYAFYFYALLLKNDEYVVLKYYPPFWMIAGILLFYFGGTAFNLIYDLVLVKMEVRNPLLSYINPTLSFLLYGFWSYSFICRARQRKLYR